MGEFGFRGRPDLNAFGSEQFQASRVDTSAYAADCTAGHGACPLVAAYGRPLPTESVTAAACEFCGRKRVHEEGMSFLSSLGCDHLVAGRHGQLASVQG